MKRWIGIIALCLTCSVSAAAPAVDDTVTVWFARHGKTAQYAGSRAGLGGYATDERGRRDGTLPAEGLKPVPFDSYYCGDAGRQRETMQIIRAVRADSSVPTIEMQALREVFSVVSKGCQIMK